jgi:hypothetical protein
LLTALDAADPVPSSDLGKQSAECLSRPVIDIEALEAIDKFEEGG